MTEAWKSRRGAPEEGASVLSADGARLICANHAATFEARTGEGVAGLGVGCALDRAPVAVDDAGKVVVRSSTS